MFDPIGETFKVIDRATFRPESVKEVRRRLNREFGEPQFVRLVDQDYVAREVWASPENQQRFILVFSRGAYELQEVRFDDADIVELNRHSGNLSRL